MRSKPISVLVIFVIAVASIRADENDYYRLESIVRAASPTHSRDKRWRPEKGAQVLEVSGMESLSNGRLAITIRKGEVWIAENVDGKAKEVKLIPFASGLHEPLGVVERKDGLYVAQRSELTKLRDTDGDQRADEYLSVNNAWGVSGNYHEYAYGPKAGKNGDLWITLNIGMARGIKQVDWRGWAVRISADGKLHPVCAGMRSPCGLGANLAGDMFMTDQQGDWIGTCSLHHLRRGTFFGHPRALESSHLPGATVRKVDVPSGLPWPEALKKIPQLRPPAVWFPYKKMGQSATDIVCDTTGGKFGPFAGQLFVGEFRLAHVMRVFLEQVDGEYQGACFPFRQGFDSAVVRLAFTKGGKLYAGLTNRGWSSIGGSSYGLQRITWTGKTPFEIKEIRAKSDGFELRFTQPVAACPTDAIDLSSYTYLLHKTYGSDEVDTARPQIERVSLSADGLRARLFVKGLREGYVHEFQCKSSIKNRVGQSLLHKRAYYTLNRIPK